ncbi:MAG: DUF983 domain-containing protein [Hyphomicrobiaceae bacterium]
MSYKLESGQSGEAPQQAETRSVLGAMRRGAACRCPACGKGALYRSFLKVADACPACGEALHHHRADDAPPYFVIFIVGHVIVGLALSLEMAFHPETWVHLALWLPLLVVLTLALLPVVKGALVGLQWANRMHGFGDAPPVGAADAAPWSGG